MSAEPYSFVIQYEIPSQNKREKWHAMKRHKDSQAAEQLVVYNARALQIPEATGFRQLRVSSYRPRLIQDYANLVGGSKGLIDSIVRTGLLVDDSDKHCNIAYCQFLLRQSPIQRMGKGWPCTMIEVWDV